MAMTHQSDICSTSCSSRPFWIQPNISNKGFLNVQQCSSSDGQDLLLRFLCSSVSLTFSSIQAKFQINCPWHVFFCVILLPVASTDSVLTLIGKRSKTREFPKFQFVNIRRSFKQSHLVQNYTLSASNLPNVYCVKIFIAKYDWLTTHTQSKVKVMT